MKIKAKEFKFSDLLSVIKESDLFWIFSFAILTAIAAQFTIPVKPVPFTLQTMMVILAGAVLGPRNGAYSQLLYLSAGIIGLPVFANSSFGIATLFGPTGGYLLAFPAAAYFVGYLVKKSQKYLFVVAAMFHGSIFIILVGTLLLYAAYLHDITEAVKAGAAIFSIWMVVKVFAAATIYYAVSKKS